MKLDLVNIIDKLPYVHKSVGETPKKKKPKNIDTPKTLGDAARFDDLPDIVDKEFMAAYRESLDNFLIPYIQQGELTITAANQFIENLIEQIFGGKYYFGIFSYLKERNFDRASDKEIVRTAERLINNGWRVRKDKNANRYKIINSDGSTVIDATGKSDLFEEAESSIMDSKSAHLFISENHASKIESLARHNFMDADDLTKKKNLNTVLNFTNDYEISGVVYNYNKLLNVLKYKNTYSTSNRGVSFTDLYSNGYILSEKMIFSNDDRFVMRKGNDEFIIYPVKGDFNQIYGVSKDMISVISSKFRENLFSSLNDVSCQSFIEIKDFNRTVALMTNYWPFDRVSKSYSDVFDTLRRLDNYVKSGEVTKEFYDRVMRAFAVVVITEALLFGNDWFSLSALGFDSISGKFYSFSTRDSFSVPFDEMIKFTKTARRYDDEISFGMFLDEVYSFRVSDGKISALIKYLPDDYFSAIESFDYSVDGYPFRFEALSDYVKKVIEFLLAVKNRGSK